MSISDSLKPYVNLSIDKIIDLKENSSKKLEIFFNSNNETEEKLVEGKITATSGNLSSSIAISLNFVKSFIPPQESETGVASCSELGGTFCKKNERCVGDSESANDGNCCIGICKPKTDRSYLGIIVGWILVIAVIGYVAWFYLRKYKGVRKVLDLLKIAKGKK